MIGNFLKKINRILDCNIQDSEDFTLPEFASSLLSTDTLTHLATSKIDLI